MKENKFDMGLEGKEEFEEEIKETLFTLAEKYDFPVELFGDEKFAEGWRVSLKNTVEHQKYLNGFFYRSTRRFIFNLFVLFLCALVYNVSNYFFPGSHTLTFVFNGLYIFTGLLYLSVYMISIKSVEKKTQEYFDAVLEED